MGTPLPACAGSGRQVTERSRWGQPRPCAGDSARCRPDQRVGSVAGFAEGHWQEKRLPIPRGNPAALFEEALIPHGARAKAVTTMNARVIRERDLACIRKCKPGCTLFVPTLPLIDCLPGIYHNRIPCSGLVDSFPVAANRNEIIRMRELHRLSTDMTTIAGQKGGVLVHLEEDSTTGASWRGQEVKRAKQEEKWYRGAFDCEWLCHLLQVQRGQWSCIAKGARG